MDPTTSKSRLYLPVRVRFSRRNETAYQKRRREQSSFYKQKLIEEDPCISLENDISVVSYFIFFNIFCPTNIG